MKYWYTNEFKSTDIIEQAQWELALEKFEEAVKQEKKKLTAKRSWFPWRIRVININEEK